MYRCPICKHNRTSKLHSDKCSKIAKETLEPTKKPKNPVNLIADNYNVRQHDTRYR